MTIAKDEGRGRGTIGRLDSLLLRAMKNKLVHPPRSHLPLFGFHKKYKTPQTYVLFAALTLSLSCTRASPPLQARTRHDIIPPQPKREKNKKKTHKHIPRASSRERCLHFQYRQRCLQISTPEFPASRSARIIPRIASHAGGRGAEPRHQLCGVRNLPEVSLGARHRAGLPHVAPSAYVHHSFICRGLSDGGLFTEVYT